MAPRAFDKEYILDWVDDLWKRRDKLAEELDWLYECCIDQFTKATNTTPLGRQASTRVRIYLHHLRTKPRRVPEKPHGYQRGRQVIVLDHPSTHARYQDLIENLGEQQDALQKVHYLFRAGM